jgi:surface polysaccharide O-acyltransferase-like enzyme
MTANAAPGRMLAFPDVAKILAIFAVVTVHVAAPANEGFGVLTDGAWLGSTVVETAMRWCVPLFVMVSGMLLLKGGTAAEAPLAFYRRRAARVAIPLVFWSLFYRAFSEHLGPHSTFLQNVQALYSGQPFYHLYFLYIIAGLYLICPFLARAIKDLSQTELAGLTIAALVLGFLWTGVTPWLPGTGSNAFSQFAPFIGYFLAGSWLARVRLSRRTTAWCAAIFVAMLAISTTVTYLWVSADGLEYGRYLYGYLSPTVIVMSLCVFLAVRELTERREARAPIRHPRRLHFLGEATFGIFLIHPFFFELWIRHPPGVPSVGHKLVWWLPATVVGLVVISFLCTVVLKQIPGLRRLV